MKKIISVILLSGLLLTSACENTDNNPTGTTDLTDTISTTTNETIEEVVTTLFYAKVLENQPETLLVEPEQGSPVRLSADKVYVTTVEAQITTSDSSPWLLSDIKVGDTVKITFDGNIAESYPAQIHSCTEITYIEAKYTIDDFWQELESTISDETTDSLINPLEKKNFRDITPGAVLEETGVQIFKDKDSCISFFTTDQGFYQVGWFFGGCGIIDAETCDFDADGTKDIMVSSSWGSGIHRSEIYVFNLKTYEQSCIYNAQVEDDEIYRNSWDLVFQKHSDGDFSVFVAEMKFDEEWDFTNIEIHPGKQVGTITTEKNAPLWSSVG